MIIACKQCGKEFELSQEEIEFYQSKGLALPKRCSECRKINKIRAKKGYNKGGYKDNNNQKNYNGYKKKNTGYKNYNGYNNYSNIKTIKRQNFKNERAENKNNNPDIKLDLSTKGIKTEDKKHFLDKKSNILYIVGFVIIVILIAYLGYLYNIKM